MDPDDLNLDQYRFTVRPMTADEGTGYLRQGCAEVLPAHHEGILDTLAATLIAEGL